MNKHFNEIKESEWLTKQDRDDFARFCFIYTKHIKDNYGYLDWEDESFKHFCKVNAIKQKGNKLETKKENYFWFTAHKLKGEKYNDIAYHFFRHIRNAVAHGLISIIYVGRNKNKYYLISDYDRDTQSMGGYIRSDLLWQMLWLLFKSKKGI